MKNAVAPFWRPYLVPLTLPGEKEPTATLRLAPTRIGFSGVRYEPQQLRIALGIDAETEVISGVVASEANDYALPDLKKIAADANTVRIVAPVRVRYEHLSATALKSLKERHFETDIPGGESDGLDR